MSGGVHYRLATLFALSVLLAPPAPADTATSSADALVCVTAGCGTPSAPALLAPAANAASDSTSQTFLWSASEGASSYDVYLDTRFPPAGMAVTGLSSTAYSVSNLQPATTYWWKVVARAAPSCAVVPATSSEVRSFTTTTSGCPIPAAFAVITPAGGATIGSGSVTLVWEGGRGAASFDVYLGTTDPPSLAVAGLTEPRLNVTNLVSGSRYYWSVVAHAACDPGKTRVSEQRTFLVAGSCAAPGGLSTLSPAPGAPGLPPSLTLSWTPSSNAAAYDVYFGRTSPPPLYDADLPGVRTSLDVSGLTTGAVYYWRVVAKASCNPALTATTGLASFSVGCDTPGTPGILFAPSGAVGVGQTYVISWSDATGLDAAGGYVVDRSRDASFSAVLDSQATSRTSASFTSSTPGTLYHRVRAIAGCGASGPASETRAVPVVAGTPNVVFSVQPQAAIAALGEPLQNLSSSFTLENITDRPLQVILGSAAVGTASFFTVRDPAGGNPALFTLPPRTPKTFELRFAGPPTDRSGSYEGILFAASTGQALGVTPYAFVNLKVGGAESAAPEFLLGGSPTEYVAFPGFAGDDAGRPPIDVTIRNPGTSPMELGAEIGPEVWLVPEEGWNAPIPAGQSRTLRLRTRRSQAPNGSALPRYTYFTARTRSGRTARLLVQDNDAASLGAGRTARLEPKARSYLIPSVVRATSAIGNTFVSKLRLSNAGTVEVQAELLFTPAGSDGFDTERVRRATVVVPPADLVNLTDPLVQLMGLVPPVSGTLEVRAAPEKIGLLTVTSTVESPAPGGGAFGFQMPTVLRGDGARLGVPHVVPGITASAAFRTNLILSETTGLDAAELEVVLYDSGGNALGSRTVMVPRYGQVQISRVVPALGGGESLRAGRLEVHLRSGGGAVVAIVTVIDNANDDAVTYAGSPQDDGSSAGFRRYTAAALPLAATVKKWVVPAVVNGFPTFRGTDSPYTFRSLMGFMAGGLSPVTFDLEYRDLQSGETHRRSVVVSDRKTVEYQNVLEELFGISPGARSQGPVLVEVRGSGFLYCKVYSDLPRGTLGDAFPVVAVPSDALSARTDQKPLYLDGLEQSVDIARGTRSNLILNEVSGRSAVVTVRLYEAGNRGTPIAETELSLAPYEKAQLSSVFEQMGLGAPPGSADPRWKDRTNVQCVVVARGGDGFVSAVVTTIDNKTGDTKNSLLTPTGGIAATGSSFGF